MSSTYLCHGQHVTDGVWAVLGTNRVSVGGDAYVTAYEHSTVWATGRAVVHAEDDSLVIAADEVRVDAKGRSSVILLGYASVWSSDFSRVRSFSDSSGSVGRSRLDTRQWTRVEVRHALVTAWHHSRVLAADRSHVGAHDQAHVEMLGGTSVFAEGRARVRVSGHDVRVDPKDWATVMTRPR